MSKRKGEWVLEDKSRGLLDVCKHRAPACWPCVASDMERQRDEARASLARAEVEARCNRAKYEGALNAIPVVTAKERDRADRAEAEVARLRAEGERMREALDALTVAVGRVAFTHFWADEHARWTSSLTSDEAVLCDAHKAARGVLARAPEAKP